MTLTLDTAQVDTWLDAARAELAERSLHEFVKRFWRTFDSAPYRDNWHIRAICDHLQAVTAGEIKRLIINIPPRCMKSSTVSVAWPAFTWAQRSEGPLSGPGVQFLFASYSHALSIRDSVKCRYVVDSPQYQDWWGDRFNLVDDQNTKIRWSNDKHGYRLATSVGGTLTGEGGSIIVIDDPLSATDAESDVKRQAMLDWWDSAMSTRLNDQTNGAIVIIMQRLHSQDLTGHVLESGNWEHLCLPMRYEVDHPHVSIHDMRTEDGALLWPEHIPEDAVSEMETTLGAYGAAGQLQQRPAPRDGGLFSEKWWKYERAAPSGGILCRGWDFAGTESGGDWTVGVMLRYVNQIWYIEDVAREQLSPLGVEKLLKDTADSDAALWGHVHISIPDDPGSAGTSVVSNFTRLLVGYSVHASPETGNKVQRAQAVSAQVEAGNVFLVQGDWNRAFVDECSLFPGKGHDDQVDAFSRAFNWITDNLDKRRDLAAYSAPSGMAYSESIW